MTKVKKEKETKSKRESRFSLFLKKRKANKIAKPRTTSQIMNMFFKSYNENTSILQLDDEHYSICFEYQDISFSKADYETQESIFLKWVSYLHSFNFNDHIQVIKIGTPVKRVDYKQNYIYDENKLQGNELRIGK